ncbi:MAG: hypothetical protein AB1625_07975 [Acidobacteriota bacterium]
MTAGVLLALVLTQSATPTYVVERVVTRPAESRRVSVFRNGLAVVAIRGAGREPHLIRVALDTAEFEVIRRVAEESHRTLQGSSGEFRAPGAAEVELRLAPPGHAPLTVRMPLASVPSHGAARMMQALDNLEIRLLSDVPGRENLSAWLPVVGDTVLLDDGSTAEVTELLDSSGGPLVRLRLGQGPAAVYLGLEELRRRAVRRVER